MARTLKICIVEKDLFVSADMSETFQRVAPTAQCLVFASVGEARAKLNGDESPDVVLVSADRTGTVPGSQADVDWVNGRRVIAFDLDGRDANPSWHYLRKPFTEEDLRIAVAAAISQTDVH